MYNARGIHIKLAIRNIVSQIFDLQSSMLVIELKLCNMDIEIH